MSIAAAQANKFYEQVARDRRVFTFTENDEFLVFPVDGKEVVPFWSSRSRLEIIQKEHVKYASFLVEEMSLQEFVEKTLPLMEAEGIHIGVNWAGKRLVGYDVEPQALKHNLASWQKKQAKNG
jgi:hypothetical protein